MNLNTDYTPEYVAWKAAKERQVAGQRESLENAVYEAEHALEEAQAALREYDDMVDSQNEQETSGFCPLQGHSTRSMGQG